MVNYALVGRCGIYCGSCALYRAYKDGGEYLQQMSEKWKMPLEKIRCEGCHALTLNCAGNKCKIVRCLNSRGFEYCFECQEYEQHSCKKYEENAKKCVNYNVDLRANLERIKAGKVEAWLKESEEEFRYPQCGKPLPALGWDNKKCYHCGVDLSKPASCMHEGKKMKVRREGGFLVAKIHQVSGRIFADILKKSDIDEINPAQGRILFVLWKKDEIPITELARKTLLSKSTLTSMLDRLEKTGYIIRVPLKKDRRIILIKRTEKDKRLENKYIQVSNKMIDLFYKGFTPKEIDDFENYLKRILANLTETISHAL